MRRDGLPTTPVWLWDTPTLSALLEQHSAVLDNFRDLLEEKDLEWQPRSVEWKKADFGADRAWPSVLLMKQVESAYLSRRGQEEAAFLAQLAAWTDGAGDALAFDESLATALGLMLRHHSTRLTRTEAQAADLAPVLQRLGDEFARAPSLAELAALAGLGRFQLLRRFRRVFGTTPHGWLMQHRAERARTLLRRGSSIADAAAQCGFADQSHLTRVFTQRFGFTPGAWKKAQ